MIAENLSTTETKSRALMDIPHDRIMLNGPPLAGLGSLVVAATSEVDLAWRLLLALASLAAIAMGFWYRRHPAVRVGNGDCVVRWHPLVPAKRVKVADLVSWKYDDKRHRILLERRDGSQVDAYVRLDRDFLGKLAEELQELGISSDDPVC